MEGKIFAIKTDNSSQTLLSGLGTKAIMIVIRENEQHEKTLSDLLNAIKLDQENDIYKLTIAENQEMNISGLLENHSIKKMVAFGFQSSELGFNINHAYNHSYEISGRQLIFAESIQELNNDKNKKIALWKTLQAVFLK